MKSPFGAKNTAYLSGIILILTLITIFLIIEFRFLKGFIGDYEYAIERIALNRVNIFVEDIITASESAARKYNQHKANTETALAEATQQNGRITNINLVNKDGYVLKSLNGREGYHINSSTLSKKDTAQTYISGVHRDSFSGNTVITASVPIYSDQHEISNFLMLDFRIDDFQKNLAREFQSDNYKIALLDKEKSSIFWPFAEKELEKYNFNDYFLKFDVVRTPINKAPWELHFFTKKTNLDTYRIITLMFLLFALYFCIYQFIVEFYNAKSLNSYFENIDFTILNHLREGIIICNKFNRVTFANKAAHDIFSDRKNVLKGTHLKDILEHINDNKFSEKKITMKKSGNLLEIAHSPILKNGKMLGSFIVIEISTEKERTITRAFEKLIELIPDGFLFINKYHQIDTANMMSKYYLGSFQKGTHINEVNSSLARIIYKNLNTASLSRTELPELELMCETIPIYDHDALYAGTMVFLKNLKEY